MIPVLFAPNTREYNNNGLGVLVDVGYCTVTEERNGAFELELQYPVNGSRYSDLSVDCQILAKPNETSNPQAFRIYNISKPMNGVVTVNAEHISYELSSIIVNPFSAPNVVEALSKIKENSVTENPFDFWTDKRTVANMSQTLPLSARSLLGGVEGSVLDTYTGEFEFDNYTVKLHQNRGADNGVVISYAKNLTGVKCEERLDGVVTGAIAIWIVKDENDQVINEVYGDLQTIQTNLSYSRNVVIDCSSDFDVEPTKEQLNAKALQYIQSHKNTPYFSVSVEFVNLGDTEEYKQYKGLYRVNLCDTVTVRHPMYGINVKAKVVKTIFDSVREKYEKIEIGEISANISRTIANQEKEMAQKVSLSQLDKAIINATNAITGNKGGYVVLNPPTNPQELLILDKPNINEAVNVWRWNLGGLGHSGNGYNGDFTTAITADGQIVADFITTGTLNASLIKAGVLTSKNGASTFSLETGTVQVGGESYSTEINNGSISQNLVSLGGVVGGIVPTGIVENGIAYETLYYNSENELAKGVSIDYEHGGVFQKIATFSKDKIVFSKPLNVNTIANNATGFINLLSTNICIGDENVAHTGSKVYVKGGIYSTADISGATITNRSDRKIKKNIKKTETKNALYAISSLSIYDYDLKHSGESVKMGLMADEAPNEILSSDRDGINLYSYCGMLAMAIKELLKKVEDLEEKNGRKN